MEIETYRVDTGIVGFFIIGSSLGFGAAFCIGICLISLLRKKSREKNKNLLPLSLKCIQKQQKRKPPTTLPPLQQPPGILFFPSISNSEPGSDTCSQKSTLSATSPLTTDGTKSFKTFVDLQRRSQETRRQNSTNSTYWRDRIWFLAPTDHKTLGIKRIRRRSLSPQNQIPKSKETTSSQTWTGPMNREITTPTGIDLTIPISNISSSLSEVIESEKTFQVMEESSKYKIGQIRLRIKHSKTTGQLFVGLFHQISLPSIMDINYTELFAKFSLLTKTVRVKKVIPLLAAPRTSPFCAVFICNVTPDFLHNSTLCISLCKKGDDPSQRVVVGVASFALNEFVTSLDEGGNFEKEFDADLLESSDRYKVDCDGVLSFDISYDTFSNSVLLLNVIFEEFEAAKISQENENKQYSELYLKAMAYKGNNALCWRRGSSVFVEPTDSSVSLASLLCLPTSLSDFKDITLVLMIKQKFTTRGKRNLLGKILLNMNTLLKDESIKKKAAAGKFWKKSIKVSLEN